MTKFNGVKTIATVNSRIHAIGVLLSSPDVAQQCNKVTPQSGSIEGEVSEFVERELELELVELQEWVVLSQECSLQQ